MEDESEPMSAEESLALIARQSEQVRRELRFDPARLLFVWGVAWFVGWGLVYVATVGSVVPGWVGGLVVSVLFVAAIGYSAYYGTRRNRGIRGPSRTAGGMYGWSWCVGYLALVAINVKIGKLGLSEESTSLLWTGSCLLLTGVLYLAGGAIFQDRLQYGLGVWIILAAVAGVLVGYPANFLVLALGGGGGLLAAAVTYLVLARRGQRVRGRAV
ncbi:hypothetical protein [Amycolatopsis samaneae]|uniref:Transporter n=1 Tax=Amycolatopsis samaneae TaxID=664691 RepID=A0ABW5G801_9PSEU